MGAFSDGSGPLATSDSIEWGTPPEFFARLDREFSFELDVCAMPALAKCARYYSPEEDGLAADWGTKRCWMNPPYGNPEQPCLPGCTRPACARRGWHLEVYKPGIVDWMEKAVRAARAGALVVSLVPARSDTDWWNLWVMPHASELRLIWGRLSFSDGTGIEKPAPFPSAVAIFSPGLRLPWRPLIVGRMLNREE